jgi:hypothetical protein
MKSPEKLVREKRASTPQTAPEKSTMGRKFASTVMQPAFEQVPSTKIKVDCSYNNNSRNPPQKWKHYYVLKKHGEV